MKLKLAVLTVAMTAAQSSRAGGLLTNTNQNVAFNRHFSREAAIGIDGVYYNPAGVAFLPDGGYISLNWQTVIQTRTIRNEYPLYANNENNGATTRRFQGKAFAPVLPSIQYAHNWGRFSLQANFAVVGGGGKCEFSDGLGSFERIVSETAIAAVGLAQTIDGIIGREMLSGKAMLGKTGSYAATSYMRGRQYYYGLSAGLGYRLNDHLAVSAGLRGVYVLSNYYGYVRGIKVGNMPLYQVLNPENEKAADIELNCDQSGIGITPILSVDYRVGRWNFAAKYEFKTRMRLKNKSVNQAPSIGTLPSILAVKFVEAGMTPEQAKAVLTSPQVAGTMQALKTKFDQELTDATGEYADGAKVAADIPALLTVGVGYNPIDALRLNVGFHYFWDRQASAYNHREDKLKRGTVEVNSGVEYDVSKKVTVSAGWQNTSYGLTPEYMDDKSFVTNSNSLGGGVLVHLSKKVDLNAAYFVTLYGHEKTSKTVQLAPSLPEMQYKADFTRTNHVLGVGVDIKI